MFKVMVLPKNRFGWEILRVFRSLKDAEDYVIQYCKQISVSDIKIVGL